MSNRRKTRPAAGPREPDPRHFERFCREVVPAMLTEGCDVGADLARRIGEDILARAESFAALDRHAQDVLIAPAGEEVAGYQPADVSLELRGAVSVVVRASLLEEAHAEGPLNEGGIKVITTEAAAPLSHFLAARRRHPVPVRDSQFAGLAAAYPRAWACMEAVTLAFAEGGRQPYRAPDAPVPELPGAEVGNTDFGPNGEVIMNATDPRFDEHTVRILRRAAAGEAPLSVHSLSRISRNPGKLFQALEYLLAHDATILTSNYLLRSDEVWVRRGWLAPIDHENDRLAAWQDLRGLSGAHRAVTALVLGLAEAEQQRGAA